MKLQAYCMSKILNQIALLIHPVLKAHNNTLTVYFFNLKCSNFYISIL
jgi:hypothetical protein